LRGLAYNAYGKIFPTTFTTSYFLTNARIGTVSTNITGTGQVSASSQIDITSKVSGDIVFLNSSINGTEIKRGTLIAQIDARDAEIALESSKNCISETC
jgi:multidrug resistance efflux pump